MKNKGIIFSIFSLLCIFLIIGTVSAVETNTTNLQAENTDILEYTVEDQITATTTDESLESAKNNEVLEVSKNEEVLNAENNVEVLKADSNIEVLGSYNTKYDFDCDYDESVQEVNHHYTFYTQHYGKQTLDVDAKDVKKLAIANSNKKYKIITYETIKKHKVTIKYTKTFYKKFKEMGHTVKLTKKQWKKELKKVKKLLKKGWKISKKTKNKIKLVKKVKKRTKIYFDLINAPWGHKYKDSAYSDSYIRIYTKYYPDLDEDVAPVLW
ncbi:hypothetical protein [uncultured Methanobrevibacter sp.]|uniref:hypothetical protein n=1 Tax=uncultured Methanobrevibacter sp. TaxID=253161 RepID=UPI0025F373D1|nr:hypothetical protein [uncultured Methanobrevibacter sp.]